MNRHSAILLSLCSAVVFSPCQSVAMPNFARKYSVECATCHTIVPKLNKAGYEFRLAGYRLPADINKEEKTLDLANFFVARLQEQFTWQKHEDVNTANNYTKSQLEFYEMTMYPLTGSWGKRYASITELSMIPGDVFEIENAYVRGVYGNENGWLQWRIGVMHPWEGFGASDRPVGNTRPLFQKAAALGSPYFLWNLDESAAEIGYQFAKAGTSIAARVGNGIIWKEKSTSIGSSANATQADPAQGGELAKGKNTPGWNDKSYQVFANQFINSSSAVSVFFYDGVVPFPDQTTGPPTSTRDRFQRFTAYANYFAVAEVLDILGGYEYGHDKLRSTTGITGAADVGNSHGFFGEVDYHANPDLAFAARFDQFDPSNKVDHNTSTAFTVSGNCHMTDGFQFIGDYQHRNTDQRAGGTNRDDTVQARLIFIW